MTQHRVVRLDLPRADSMRAPGEAVGMLALECAMDELAYKLGLDPVELRMRNEAERAIRRRTCRIPRASWSSACRRAPGASAGTSAMRRPGQVRDGRWLVGMGMAAVTRSNYLQLAKASVRSTATAC